MKQIYRLLLIVLFLGGIGCTTTVPARKYPILISNQFQAVWDQVIIDVVDKLPQERISFGSLFSATKNIILGDATRTLDEHADILQPFNKLAHPNGICLKGTWNIYADNKYSGYFKKNSKALIIVRASTAMSNTRDGEIRSFGFAGKIFPTINPQEIIQENTANFFLIDDLGGTRAAHYTDVALSNEPSVSKNSEVFKNLLYVLKLARTFSQADINPSIRQVYEISQLGEPKNKKIITPRWMKVEAKQGQTVEESDFRNELQLSDNEKLVFSISVASKEVDSKRDWKSIGEITLDKSVVSKSCDHRLHFHHPVWKLNLNH